MDLRTELLREHSKIQCGKIVGWVGDKQSRFNALMDVFREEDSSLIQRASAALSHCVYNQPHLVEPHFSLLFDLLQQPERPPAVRRNVLRILQRVPIPQAYQGLAMNLCFDFLCDPKEKAAVKAFSLTVLDNLSKEYPEIRAELQLIVRENWDRETPAFRSRARHLRAG